MPLVNNFLLGADPEFVIQDAGHLRQFTARPKAYVPWGLDHSGWVIEPHPKPEKSVRDLIKNLKVSMNDFATVAPAGKWRAGAWIEAPERSVSLGGHVHVDLPRCETAQVAALDLLTRHLEALDILPRTECLKRRGGSYGNYGDIRTEHGHFEYRTPPSWLFSQRVAKICLIGAKLAVVDSASASEALGVVEEASVIKLKNFFERFQNRDDDVDWILGAGILGKKLNVKPDRDLKDVWKVEPVEETPRWKQEKANETVPRRNETIAINPFSPYFYQIGEGYCTVSPDRGYLRTLPFLRSLVLPNFETGMAMHVGEFFIQWCGSRGQNWDARVPFRDFPIVVDGNPHLCRVHANQEISPAVRVTIRYFIQRSTNPIEDRLVLSNGLMFQVLN